MPPDGGSLRLARAWLARVRGICRMSVNPTRDTASGRISASTLNKRLSWPVKAVLVFQGVGFPRTHKIEELLVLLRPAGQHVPEHVWSGRDLSDYAVITRYPISDESVDRIKPVSEDEYRRAVRLGGELLRWAEAVIGG